MDSSAAGRRRRSVVERQSHRTRGVSSAAPTPRVEWTTTSRRSPPSTIFGHLDNIGFIGGVSAGLPSAPPHSGWQPDVSEIATRVRGISSTRASSTPRFEWAITSRRSPPPIRFGPSGQHWIRRRRGCRAAVESPHVGWRRTDQHNNVNLSTTQWVVDSFRIL